MTEPIFVTEDHRLRVKRGATWLDEHRPGWESRIDFATFNIRYSCHCVLGQVFEATSIGSAWANGVALSGLSFGTGRLEWITDHGFDADGILAEDYSCLQQAWLDLLADRGYTR